MDDEEINYRFLRKIQQMEKSSPKLSDIRQNFYKEIYEYIQNLEKRKDSEESEQKKKILDEEIENTRKIVNDIYEKREKKIILSAISKARGATPNISNMLDSEKDLYNSIFDTIKNSKNKILSNKKDEDNDTKKKQDEIEENEKEKELTEDISVIRLKKDIPEFIGTDKKKYNLKKDDIISIPKDMCKMLCNKNVSERINIKTKI